MALSDGKFVDAQGGAESFAKATFAGRFGRGKLGIRAGDAGLCPGL